MGAWFERQWQIIAEMSDSRVPLLDGALLIARDEYPDLNIGAVAAEVHAMAHGLITDTAPGSSEADRLEALHTLLFDDLGFRGNREDYYDPRNSYLNEVLARRTGIPISLAVIYIEIGRLLGLPLRGVGFPGHFLVRLDGQDGLRLLDPFNRGVSVSVADLARRLGSTGDHGRPAEAVAERMDELIRPTGNRHILVRMLRNLKAIYLGAQDNHRALRCSDRIVTLLPNDALEYRDRGTLYLTMGAKQPAALDLERYLQLAPAAEDREEVEAQIRWLSSEGRTLH